MMELNHLRLHHINLGSYYDELGLRAVSKDCIYVNLDTIHILITGG
jgi:hypothetical protein